MNLWGRFRGFLVGLDEAVNAAGGGKPTETLSGTVGRAQTAGKWWGWFLAYGIDGLLGEGHCARMAEKEARYDA